MQTAQYTTPIGWNCTLNAVLSQCGYRPSSKTRQTKNPWTDQDLIRRNWLYPQIHIIFLRLLRRAFKEPHLAAHKLIGYSLLWYFLVFTPQARTQLRPGSRHLHIRHIHQKTQLYKIRCFWGFVIMHAWRELSLKTRDFILPCIILCRPAVDWNALCIDNHILTYWQDSRNAQLISRGRVNLDVRVAKFHSEERNQISTMAQYENVVLQTTDEKYFTSDRPNFSPRDHFENHQFLGFAS